MSDPISDTYAFPAARLHRKRPYWIKTMAEDSRALSVTKVHLPIVMAISIIAAIAGGLMGVSWTAATKATTLDQLNAQVAAMSTQMTVLTTQSTKTGVQVDAMSKQMDRMQTQIDQLEQKTR